MPIGSPPVSSKNLSFASSSKDLVEDWDSQATKNTVRISSSTLPTCDATYKQPHPENNVHGEKSVSNEDPPELLREKSTLHLNARMTRLARRSTILTYSNAKVSYWIMEPVARNYVVRLSTVFYAIFIIIVGVVLELSNLIAFGTEQAAHPKDLAFAIYMYGAACAVIAFCAVNIYQEHARLRNIRRALARVIDYNQDEPEMLSNPSTGSLYLRVGCIVFGLMGVIYYVLMGMMCIFGHEGHTQNECNPAGILIYLFAAMFVFMQMWFVYCNGKVVINGRAKYIIQLGLMHLVAVNLWLWIRYILYEEAQTIKEIKLARFQSTDEATRSFVKLDHSDESDESQEMADESHEASHHVCAGVQCIFGDFSEFMYTCVVEYCLICAGVSYVFWTNISSPSDTKEGYYVSHKLRKRNMIRIDCSRTAEGLFVGFIFLIASIIAVILFNAYSDTHSIIAQGIFLSTNMLFYTVAILMCAYAFWRMKVLSFNNEPEEEHESAELLDEILLVVGLIGELVYCIGGILAFVNNSHKLSISLLLLVLNMLRLVQVTMQSALLMTGARLTLDLENPKSLRYKPGKQVITLLLIVNLALFIMNIFEAQKAGVTDEIVQLYGSRSWALVVRGCSPLTIFFSGQ